MKRNTLMMAGVALTLAATSALAFTPIGNNSNKGSLLIYPRIQVGGGQDTVVTLVNDYSFAIRLKCYYATSDPVPTPNTFAANTTTARGWKHKIDFTIDLTHNQPISWLASTGQVIGNSQRASGQVAPPFGFFPDGTNRAAGELKCWAVTDDGLTERHHNHLFGTASVMDFGNSQAYQYTAWAFQAMGPSTSTGISLGSPGQLNLDNVEYDACPNMLLGDFIPVGAPTPFGGPATQVTLASCNQDLRQAYTPTLTKLTWTFWNQDEQARTGAHACANSWYENAFPADRWLNANYASLGTLAAYFRIQTTADTQVCGPSAVTSSYVGTKAEAFGAGFLRGTNLVGRGVSNGLIQYDPSPADSWKKPL